MTRTEQRKNKRRKNKFFFSPYLTEEQSVSKWEGAQSTPDLERILKMSEIFGVSTDYLLKEEYEEESIETQIAVAEEKIGNILPKKEDDIRYISKEKAEKFLEDKRWSATRFSLAIFLYIMSPIPFFGMVFLQSCFPAVISDQASGVIGLSMGLIFIVVATAIRVNCNVKMNAYEFMKQEPIEIECEVSELVIERRKQFESNFYRLNIMGLCLCVLSVVPVWVGSLFISKDVMVGFAMLFMPGCIGCGVYCIIKARIIWDSMKMLLQEGKYSLAGKQKTRKNAPLVSFYWTLITTLFLLLALFSGELLDLWIIWPIAGILFVGIMAVYNFFTRNRPDNQ